MKTIKYTTICPKCENRVEYDKCPDHTPIICSFCKKEGRIKIAFFGEPYVIWN